LRIVAWDDLEPFALLNTLTVFVHLPAWVVAIVAVAGRRFALGVASFLVVVAQVAFMLPDLTARNRCPVGLRTRQPSGCSTPTSPT
jgi:hypothetical protein